MEENITNVEKNESHEFLMAEYAQMFAEKRSYKIASC